MVATGCTTTQTYPGPQLPPEMVAKLEGTYNYYLVCDVECEIATVDGKGVADMVEILPGQHTVTLYLTKSCYDGPRKFGVPQTFSFIAEAGHVYKADGNWNGGDNQIWIIDKTGNFVAGMKPLPHEKVARLKGKRLFFLPLCAIAAVDGKIMSEDFTMEAEMFPGKHEVTIKLAEPFIPSIWRFSFIAEADHVYQVEAYWKTEGWHVVDNQMWIWIVDKETGQVVAGEKP